MSVVSLSGATTMATGSPQFPLVVTIVGSLCGVILLSIVVVIVVISLLIREKVRGIILCSHAKKLELSRVQQRAWPTICSYILQAMPINLKHIEASCLPNSIDNCESLRCLDHKSLKIWPFACDNRTGCLHVCSTCTV